MAVNKTDWSFGWHGHRAGLALYYFDDVVMQNDHHELSLTSGLTLHAQLMITKNKLLGSPYTKCLPKTKASECYRKTTEDSFETSILNSRVSSGILIQNYNGKTIARMRL